MLQLSHVSAEYAGRRVLDNINLSLSEGCLLYTSPSPRDS